MSPSNLAGEDPDAVEPTSNRWHTLGCSGDGHVTIPEVGIALCVGCVNCTGVADGPPGLINDLVNHPKHYTSHPSGVEAITVCEHMGFNIGNAIKYLWRAGEKGSLIQDYEKAVWYIKREIERRKGE